MGRGTDQTGITDWDRQDFLRALPRFLYLKAGHRVMFCVQAKDLAPGLHKRGSENSIVGIQPMAGLPAPVQRRRCVNDPLLDGCGFELR